MFRKKKGPDDVQGFNRISRLIEDRQRELRDDDAPLDDTDEDTILMRPSTPAQPAAPATSSQPASTGRLSDDDEGVSLLAVRGRPDPVTPPETTAEYEPAYGSGSPEADQLDATLPVAPAPDAVYAPQPAEEQYQPEPEPYRSSLYAEPEHEEMPVPDLGPAHAGSSLVAVEATWEGTLRSDGDIRIEGTLRGEIDTAATLVIAPHARVHGTIRAKNILIGGDVEGEVTCEERLEILPGGSARGQISSGTLVIHEGAYIDSRFQMRREPAESGV